MRTAPSSLPTLLAAIALVGCGQVSPEPAAAAQPLSGSTPPRTAPTSGDEPQVRVEELPLKRGYYVSSDTPCAEASNATLMLLRRDGVGGARDFCAFQAIVRIGPNAYRVTQACGDLQDPAPPQTSTATYTLSGDKGFTAAHEDGWRHSARYCAQASLPADWRDTDISDLTR